MRSLGPSDLAVVEAMTRREVSLLPNRQIVGEGEIGLGLYMLTEAGPSAIGKSANATARLSISCYPAKSLGYKLLFLVSSNIRYAA